TRSVPVPARPRRASRTASSASSAPDVFGSSATPGGTKSRMSPSPTRSRSTRRSATVTISARLASTASRISGCDPNFPVPTTSRLPNVRAPTTSGSRSAAGAVDHPWSVSTTITPLAGITPIGWCGSPAGCGRPLSPRPAGSPVLTHPSYGAAGTPGGSVAALPLARRTGAEPDRYQIGTAEGTPRTTRYVHSADVETAVADPLTGAVLDRRYRVG